MAKVIGQPGQYTYQDTNNVKTVAATILDVEADGQVRVSAGGGNVSNVNYIAWGDAAPGTLPYFRDITGA